MNKKLITVMAAIGGTVGGYLPVLFGDNEFLDGWTILTATVGGLLGVWLGVILSKRLG